MNYVVQPGDTLNSISARFGVPIEELIRVNNLRPPFFLFPGQTLFIPTRPPGPPRPPFPPRPDNLARRVDRLENQVANLDRRVDNLDRRVDNLERRVRRLEERR